jgi:hypothetical protein
MPQESPAVQKSYAPSAAELEELDRFYREGGLRQMASPHVPHQDANCPHTSCGHRMEWIDFQLELYGDSEGIYEPLVRAWSDGRGLVGRRPACGGWSHFTTLKMEAASDGEANQVPRLPDNWHTAAQVA